MKTLRRHYPSNYASVSKARREVTSFARGCGLFSADISDIVLAVGEACSNAAEHGHVADGRFVVGATFENGEFVVEVADGGIGFDPVGKGSCLDPENLGMRGLGIFIMRSLMDDVCFSMNHAGMSVRMTKYGLTLKPGLRMPGDGNGRGGAGLRLGAFHDQLKSLLEFARVHASSRRQR